MRYQESKGYYHGKPLSQKDIRALLFIECGGICPQCGRKMQNKNRNQLDTYMTVDHIIPKSKGGRKNFENLRPLCRKCNNERGSRPVEQLTAFKDIRGKWCCVPNL